MPGNNFAEFVLDSPWNSGKRSIRKRSVVPTKLLKEPTQEDIEKHHDKIIDLIKNNYDNRDISPLTLHNALHSFEKFFFQYTDWLKEMPECHCADGYILFKWADKLHIRAQGPNFTYRWKGTQDIALYRREELMKRLASYDVHYKFPISPC